MSGATAEDKDAVVDAAEALFDGLKVVGADDTAAGRKEFLHELNQSFVLSYHPYGEAEVDFLLVV